MNIFCNDKIMGSYEDILNGLKEYANTHEGPSWFAGVAGVSQSQVSKFFNNNLNMGVKSVGKMLDAVQAKIVFPGEEAETARPVHFVRPQIVSSEELAEGPTDENHIAVPLAKRPVAAGNGIIPDDRIESWVLVWRGQFAVRHRSNLAVVRVDNRDGDSMIPTLHPDDLVLIDRNDWEPKNPPGNIYLVQTPDGDEMGLKIKRARIQRKNGQELIIFYSDNPEHAPEIYDMHSDYENDLRRAIKGRVIWSWSDMTKK